MGRSIFQNLGKRATFFSDIFNENTKKDVFNKTYPRKVFFPKSRTRIGAVVYAKDILIFLSIYKGLHLASF